MMEMIPRRRAPWRIGHLIESDGPGGAEQVVAQLSGQLVTEGHTVTLFTPAKGEGWLRERLHGSPVRVAPLPLDGPFSIRTVAAIAAAARAAKLHVLHTHEFGQSLNGATAAWWLRIPHVITMHGGRYYAERQRRRLALRLAIRLSRATIAVSGSVASHLERALGLGAGSVQVIPNGARPAAGGANGVRESLGIPVAASLLLAVGNLYPVKGHCHLITAMALLAERHPEIHLMIAGRGDGQAALRAQAHDAGLSARVHLLGLRPDVGALLHAADLFVHPSLDEGLPLAVLEAMFAGRPVIASAVGELPTVLASGAAGTLVPPGRPTELAEAIARLLETPTLAVAQAAEARERAEAEYGLERMAGRYQDVYDRVLGRSARSYPSTSRMIPIRSS